MGHLEPFNFFKKKVSASSNSHQVSDKVDQKQQRLTRCLRGTHVPRLAATASADSAFVPSLHGTLFRLAILSCRSRSSAPAASNSFKSRATSTKLCIRVPDHTELSLESSQLAWSMPLPLPPPALRPTSGNKILKMLLLATSFLPPCPPLPCAAAPPRRILRHAAGTSLCCCTPPLSPLRPPRVGSMPLASTASTPTTIPTSTLASQRLAPSTPERHASCTWSSPCPLSVTESALSHGAVSSQGGLLEGLAGTGGASSDVAVEGGAAAASTRPALRPLLLLTRLTASGAPAPCGDTLRIPEANLQWPGSEAVCAGNENCC